MVCALRPGTEPGFPREPGRRGCLVRQGNPTHSPSRTSPLSDGRMSQGSRLFATRVLPFGSSVNPCYHHVARSTWPPVAPSRHSRRLLPQGPFQGALLDPRSPSARCHVVYPTPPAKPPALLKVYLRPRY